MQGSSECAIAVWFTGLPSSGKSTIAKKTAEILRAVGQPVVVLDSDELRRELTPDPTYTKKERDWFYGVLAFMAELLTNSGVTTLIAATAPRREYRDNARKRIGLFCEVFVKCSVNECRRRDPKGLWAKEKQSKISNLPGAGAPYEQPLEPELVVNTEQQSPEKSAQLVADVLSTPLFLNN